MVHHSSFLSSRTSSVPPSGSHLPCATYSPSRWPVLPPSQPSASTRSSVLHNNSVPRLYNPHRPSITQHLGSSTRFKCQLGCRHYRSGLPYSTLLNSSVREEQQPTPAQHLEQQTSRSTVVLNDLGQAQLLKLSSTALRTPLHLQPLVREKTNARSRGHTSHATVAGVCARPGEVEGTVVKAATRHARKFKVVQQTRPLHHTASSSSSLHCQHTTSSSSSFHGQHTASSSSSLHCQHTASSSSSFHCQHTASYSSLHCSSSSHCPTNDDAPAAISIDTFCGTRQRDSKDGEATSHAWQRHHPEDQPAQVEGASSPMTPIPTDSRFVLDSVPSTTTASLAYTDRADPPRSQAVLRADMGPPQCNNSSVNTVCSPPQACTRPPPIVTRSLQTGLSPSLGRGDNHSVHDVECVPIAAPTGDSEHASNQKRSKLGGRDSGIALESWDLPHCGPSYTTEVHSETDGAEANKVTEHLLQRVARGLGLDGQQDRSTGRVDGRRRCQSMAYATGCRKSQDWLSPSDDELIFRMDTNTCSSTAEACYDPSNRGRRRDSISLGCERGRCPRSPSLPPLPPMSGANCVPRTSFFCSPSDNKTEAEDSERDRSQRHALYNDNISFQSSSMPNPAAILLSKSPLPSSLPESALPHGVPFSTMLDLATAKAENITGLYFARQMNFKATSAVSLTGSAETTPGTQQPGISLEAVKVNLADPERSSNGVFEEAGNIRIKVSAPSPIVRRERILTDSGDGLHSTLGGTRLSCPQPAIADPSLPPLPGVSNRDVATSKRCRAVTSSETFVSPLFSCDDQSTAVESSSRAESAHVPGGSPASHSAPTRGHHRRSQSASHFFHLSSLKHHSPAQFNLALCYEHGQGGVERDLQMALHFYQQAADQGHTKASYNIGCICYNSGEVSKAMAWFESAGKCSVRGLRTEAAEKSSSSSSDQAPPPLQCPIPKHTSLPHELEDILLGDMAATSGPFAAYLPAILCLALLCRQGVQSRDGTVILERDQEQAIELLQRLLQRTSARSHLGTRGGNSQDAANDMAGSSSSSKAYGDLRKRSSFDVRASAQCPATPGSTTVVPASLATSCPSLPSKQWGMSSGAAHGSATYDPLGRSLAVQETLDGEKDCGHDVASGSGVNSGLVNPTLFSAELQGPDLHEAWSATLALQLLKAWTRHPAERQCEMTATNEISLDQKILRHHLLYITNPTHGKNLYNLGVLYDICLGEHLIAARCYESAYRNSRLAEEASCGAHSTLVTRINSAWNLGVIHAKHQEWSQARCWFLKAQQDVLLHAQRQGEQDVKSSGKDHVHRDRTKTHASLVNVIPGDMRYSPSDCPEKARAREHGLMMSFSSLGESSKAGGSPRAGKCKRTLKKRQHRQAQEGLETDISKVAWVLRWIDSNMKSSA